MTTGADRLYYCFSCHYGNTFSSSTKVQNWECLHSRLQMLVCHLRYGAIISYSKQICSASPRRLRANFSSRNHCRPRLNIRCRLVAIFSGCPSLIHLIQLQEIDEGGTSVSRVIYANTSVSINLSSALDPLQRSG